MEHNEMQALYFIKVFRGSKTGLNYRQTKLFEQNIFIRKKIFPLDGQTRAGLFKARLS